MSDFSRAPTVVSADQILRNSTRDGEFKESDHPRADNGKFGSGGGSSSKGEQLGPTERREPGAMLPKKNMSDRMKTENSKAMAKAAASAKSPEAKSHFEEAAAFYSKGNHEAGSRAEKQGHHADRRAGA